ncbi:hypothetical protein [Candidatus Palauibacter sp.]
MAAHDRLNGSHEIGVGGRLVQKTIRAGFEGGHQEIVLVVDREH